MKYPHVNGVYGPFHRIKTEKQSYEVAKMQLASQEIWGRPHMLNGLFPMAKAYVKGLCYGEQFGPECEDEEGVEFTTKVEPDSVSPGGTLYWRHKEGREGVRKVDDDFVALAAHVYKLNYSEERLAENGSA